jgi:hypothetical protein
LVILKFPVKPALEKLVRVESFALTRVTVAYDNPLWDKESDTTSVTVIPWENARTGRKTGKKYNF